MVLSILKEKSQRVRISVNGTLSDRFSLQYGVLGDPVSVLYCLSFTHPSLLRLLTHIYLKFIAARMILTFIFFLKPNS